MLVLTRRPNEQIHIGDNIKVTILRIKGNTVRLGIEAPRQVRVIRAEIEAFPSAPATSDELDADAMSAVETDLRAWLQAAH